MNWYKQSMPQIKNVKPFIKDICKEIKNIKGVNDIYIFGSFVDKMDNPNSIISDIDLIAITNFDSGDLLAIDNSRYSALKINPKNLLDEGFNPEVVDFTKNFLKYQNFNIDHWVLSKSKDLLHWGAIPETKEEWMSLHTKSEEKAVELTGIKKQDLYLHSDHERKEWKVAFNNYSKEYLDSSYSGWFQSETSFKDIKEKAIRWDSIKI